MTAFAIPFNHTRSMMQTQSRATHIQNVQFSYNDKPVLRDLSFEVMPGQILGLLGPNGAGKTTMFNLLAGLLRPHGGQVRVVGLDPVKDGMAARRVTAFLPDEPLLYPNLSALENLCAYAVLWNVPPKLAKSRSEQLLQEVGLWEFRNAWSKTYSRGMKQKLALCAALLHEPQLLLMDEPLSGLDIDASIWARDMLHQFAANGGTVILTSHAPELMEAIVDRAVILKDGRVGLDVSIQELRDQGGLIASYQRLQQSSERV
jgi:ABC-2 type transport system ATP-binding protein